MYTNKDLCIGEGAFLLGRVFCFGSVLVYRAGSSKMLRLIPMRIARERWLCYTWNNIVFLGAVLRRDSGYVWIRFTPFRHSTSFPGHFLYDLADSVSTLRGEIKSNSLDKSVAVCTQHLVLSHGWRNYCALSQGQIMKFCILLFIFSPSLWGYILLAECHFERYCSLY